MNEEVYDANVRIRDLPKSVDRMLGAIASANGKLKWQVVKEALIEYVENHKIEAVAVLRNPDGH